MKHAQSFDNLGFPAGVLDGSMLKNYKAYRTCVTCHISGIMLFRLLVVGFYLDIKTVPPLFLNPTFVKNKERIFFFFNKSNVDLTPFLTPFSQIHKLHLRTSTVYRSCRLLIVRPASIPRKPPRASITAKFSAVIFISICSNSSLSCALMFSATIFLILSFVIA